MSEEIINDWFGLFCFISLSFSILVIGVSILPNLREEVQTIFSFTLLFGGVYLGRKIVDYIESKLKKKKESKNVP